MQLLRLLAAGLLVVIASNSFAQGEPRPVFTESFENLAAPAAGAPLKLPPHWALSAYGDGTRAVPVASIADHEGKKALRYLATFPATGTYWGVLLSSPALATKVATYGVPTKITFDILSASGRDIEVLVHSQNEAYQETGTLSTKLKLKAGEWTKAEIALNGSSTLGAFSVLDAHLVLIMHTGNNQGYAANDTVDITIDNVVLHSVSP